MYGKQRHRHGDDRPHQPHAHQTVLKPITIHTTTPPSSASKRDPLRPLRNPHPTPSSTAATSRPTARSPLSSPTTTSTWCYFEPLHQRRHGLPHRRHTTSWEHSSPQSPSSHHIMGTLFTTEPNLPPHQRPPPHSTSTYLAANREPPIGCQPQEVMTPVGVTTERPNSTR